MKGGIFVFFLSSSYCPKCPQKGITLNEVVCVRNIEVMRIKVFVFILLNICVYVFVYLFGFCSILFWFYFEFCDKEMNRDWNKS